MAETTEPKHRTEYMAYLTAMQYTGFAVMPIVGAVLSTVGNEHSGELLLGMPFLQVILTVTLCTRTLCPNRNPNPNPD